MADHVRRLSTEKNVAQVHSFHSFIRSTDADDKSKVATLYDDWTSYDEDVQKVAYKGPSESGVMVSQYCKDKSISILDCGSGTGLVGEVLYPHGFKNVTALDISQKSLDIAKAKGVYSRLICTQAGKHQMPFEENEFDALVCVGCFIPGHMNQEVFPDWLRVVKPGGYIFLIMRTSYLQEGEFKGQFDQAIQTHVDAKRWVKVEARVIPEYFDMFEGVGFVFKVL
ncbi:methyltransferase-like protein 27 [Apostichopus japonicus]